MTGYSSEISPLSARYAAQLKELLTHQVRERIAEVEKAAEPAPEPARLPAPAAGASIAGEPSPASPDPSRTVATVVDISV
jgi:hypothetical protein